MVLDPLDPYRQMVRSMRFVPPLLHSQEDSRKLTEPAILPSSSLPTTSDRVNVDRVPLKSPPVDPSDRTLELIRTAVSQPTALPIAYTIQENIGDRISRLSSSPSASPINASQLAGPSPTWIPLAESNDASTSALPSGLTPVASVSHESVVASPESSSGSLQQEHDRVESSPSIASNTEAIPSDRPAAISLPLDETTRELQTNLEHESEWQPALMALTDDLVMVETPDVLSETQPYVEYVEEATQVAMVEPEQLSEPVAPVSEELKTQEQITSLNESSSSDGCEGSTEKAVALPNESSDEVNPISSFWDMIRQQLAKIVSPDQES
jgi:hypothetical protein